MKRRAQQFSVSAILLIALGLPMPHDCAVAIFVPSTVLHHRGVADTIGGCSHGRAGPRYHRVEEADMADKSITKVASKHSPRGQMGQKYLASGVHVAMRLWEHEPPGEPTPTSRREYETVGYVIDGRAELHLEGQTVLLEPGDSWVVPQGSAHTYKILEAFTAVEATYPPAQVHGRDER